MFSKEAVLAFLQIPFIDRLFGLISLAPAFYSLYLFFYFAQQGQVDVYRTGMAANLVVLIVSVLFRRTAKRISLKAFFWFVTAGRSYWVFLVFMFVDVGASYASLGTTSTVISTILLWLAVVVIVYARFSLGRNIGFIPARRELVTTGAYGWVRHPIHTGEFLFIFSYMLAFFSISSLVLFSIGLGFVIWKSVIEERFLGSDEDYREYCKKVPYRWVPGLI